MTAIEFWRSEVEREQGYLTGNEPFSSMRSWTVGMFEIVMAFAEKYAAYRLNVAEKEATK